MIWLIKKGFYSEKNRTLLTRALDFFSIPYYELNPDQLFFYGEQQPHLDKLVCGGTRCIQEALARGWRPGAYINENFEFPNLVRLYGDHLLNSSGLVCKLSELPLPPVEGYFCRPLGDTKQFNGGLISQQEYHYFKTKLLSTKGDFPVVCAKRSTVLSEFRFFVVDGKVVSYSQYRRGNAPYISSDVDQEALSFARLLASSVYPSRAYVLDIAYSDRGYKVIELNNITSANFYAADVQKIVYSLAIPKG